MVAVLEDDCFAAGPEMIRAAEAWDRLRQRLSCIVSAETVLLDHLAGRILAEDIIASRSLPDFDNSAVDGYAVRHADLLPEQETTLTIGPRVAAGDLGEALIGTGEAARIFTGAPMPVGADTVVMQEDVRCNGGQVIIPAGISEGANRRLAGEDVGAAACALCAGTVLRPQEVGMLAALGRPHARVYAPLRVALFSSGDELRVPGDELPRGAVYDANRYMLGSLLAGNGVNVTHMGILPDQAIPLKNALGIAARDHHVIITSAGASVGDEDHVIGAVRELGSLHFWSIAVKPGRPLAFGQIGDTLFIGLPGNPVAAMICFLMFIRPVLRLLGGGAWADPRGYTIRSDFDFRKKPGRLEWLRGSVFDGPGGQTIVRRFPKQGSGIITSLTASDGLIELSEDVTQVWRGELVRFIPFAELGVV